MDQELERKRGAEPIPRDARCGSDCVGHQRAILICRDLRIAHNVLVKLTLKATDMIQSPPLHYDIGGKHTTWIRLISPYVPAVSRHT